MTLNNLLAVMFGAMLAALFMFAVVWQTDVHIGGYKEPTYTKG